MGCCRKLRELCRRDRPRTRVEWAGGVIEFDASVTPEQAADFVALFDLLARGDADAD